MGNRIFAVLLLWSVMAVGIATAQRRVAITVDDLPLAALNTGAESELATAHDVNAKLLEAFRRHHVKAVGFVNEDKVERNGLVREHSAILEDWLKAGMTLGNHTYSHANLSESPLEEFEKNTEDGEKTIAPLLKAHGQKLRFFRYPFNSTGGSHEKKLAFEAYLKRRGYEIATCTIENSDYIFNQIYLNALGRGDRSHADEIRKAYLEFSGMAIDGYLRASRQVIGRDFPQVMLLHANRLNADSIDEILKLFEARGYKFVTLEKAQKDPAYLSLDLYEGPYGWMWQQRWAIARKVKLDFRDMPDPPKWVLDEFRNKPAGSH